MKTGTLILFGALGIGGYYLVKNSGGAQETLLTGLSGGSIGLPDISINQGDSILPSFDLGAIADIIKAATAAQGIAGTVKDATEDIINTTKETVNTVTTDMPDDPAKSIIDQIKEALGIGTTPEEPAVPDESGTKESGGVPDASGYKITYKGWADLVTGWQGGQIKGQGAYDITGLSSALAELIQNTPGLDVQSGALPWQTPTGFGAIAPWRKTVKDETTGKIITSSEAVRRAYEYEQGRRSGSGNVTEPGRRSGSGVGSGEAQLGVHGIPVAAIKQAEADIAANEAARHARAVALIEKIRAGKA